MAQPKLKKIPKKFLRNSPEVSSFCSDVIFINIEKTSEINQQVINSKQCNITMRKIVRLTENELKQLMHNSVVKALENKDVVNEQVDWEREIRLAQKVLMKMSPLLSELGLRLDGTRFRLLYLDVKDSLVTLNNALIQHIKRGEEKK